MKFIYIPFLFIFQFCSNSENKNKTVVENKDTANFNKDVYWDTAGAEIIDTLPIYVKLKIIPCSLDSIIANIVFLNSGNNNIWLYKPILPIDSLTENTFTILNENFFKLPFLRVENNHRYYSEKGEIISLIIPDLSKTNLLELSAGDSLEFNINLAKYYDFRILKKNGSKTFLIEYTAIFPFIENGKHVFTINGTFNTYQPVYITLTSARIISESFRTKIKLPKN